MTADRKWVALLRAVNVGGTGAIAMADLKAVAASLGWAQAKTILQSGSLVFAASGDAHGLEQALEAGLEDALGLRTDVMVRAADTWASLVAGNPFAAMARTDPSHLLLLILKSEARTAGLNALPPHEEEIALAPGAAYVTYPHGVGRSKLTTAALERRLGARATGRNWNTVLKIAAALGL